jgi:hypothetical protein
MSSTRQYMAYAGSALLGAAIVGAVVLVHGRVSTNPLQFTITMTVYRNDAALNFLFFILVRFLQCLFH